MQFIGFEYRMSLIYFKYTFIALFWDRMFLYRKYLNQKNVPIYLFFRKSLEFDTRETVALRQ
jgi:hypothetical protein